MTELLGKRELIDVPDETWLFEAGISQIEGSQGQAIQALYEENWFYIATAPGSRKKHQAWIGGYQDHIAQFNTFVEFMFTQLEICGVLDALHPDERFTISDALAVGALHDIEKPFIYEIRDGEVCFRETDEESKKAFGNFNDKEAREKFRQAILECYGIVLTSNQANAMRFVEGLRDADYSPEVRVMGPLATLAHMADQYSGGLCYNLHR